MFVFCEGQVLEMKHLYCKLTDIVVVGENEFGGDFGFYGESISFDIQVLVVVHGDFFEGFEGVESFLGGDGFYQFTMSVLGVDDKVAFNVFFFHKIVEDQSKAHSFFPGAAGDDPDLDSLFVVLENFGGGFCLLAPRRSWGF